MNGSTQLSLHESILLLALRDETGKATGGWWKHALGGAVLAELMFAGKVEIEGGKKSFVNVIDAKPTGDAALDSCLKKVTNAKRRAQAPSWISRFANHRDLKHIVARALCLKGVLVEDEARVLIFFRQTVYPEINPKPERDLIRRILDVALDGSVTPDTPTRALIAIAHAGELLKPMMDKQDWKASHKRLDEVMESDPIGYLTHKAVEAAQAAAVTAATSGGVVAATG